MEINIFPFICKIYIVHCNFCGKFLGHLVMDTDDLRTPEDVAKRFFGWCSPECSDKKHNMKPGERWLDVIPFIDTSTI